jgi:hypothetical protein
MSLHWEGGIVLVSVLCAAAVAVHRPKRRPARVPHRYQVFGYDVLIDQNLKPWLIEVNASPSMGVDSEVDVRVKGQMIADTVKLVLPCGFISTASSSPRVPVTVCVFVVTVTVLAGKPAAL